MRHLRPDPYLFLESDGRLVRVSQDVEQTDALGTQPRLHDVPLSPEQRDAREEDRIEGRVSQDWLVGGGGQEEVHGDRDDGRDSGVYPDVAR